MWCVFCEQDLANMRTHKKTKKHRMNWFRKINKIKFLPLDLQRVISQYIACFCYSKVSMFKTPVIQERQAMNMRCWWNCRKFYQEMYSDYRFELWKFTVQLKANMINEGILLNKKDNPSWFINGSYISTTKPIADYLRAFDENTWGMDLLRKYVEHKYPFP